MPKSNIQTYRTAEVGFNFPSLHCEYGDDEVERFKRIHISEKLTVPRAGAL